MKPHKTGRMFFSFINKIFFILFLTIGITMTTSAKPVLNIQHWTTSNGVQVLFVATHELPMLDIRINFSAGSAQDNELFGIAAATNGMLKEGTKKLTADQIATKLDEVGAIYADGVDLDRATLNLRTVTDPKILASALKTFTAILTAPTFPKTQWQRVQQQTLSAIKQQEQYPDSVANRVFFQALYGDTPYGHPVLGTIESVKKITPLNLQAFYDKYYVGKNAVMIMVGDLDLTQAKNISEAVVSNLPPGKAATTTSTTNNKNSEIKHIKFPSEQTHIMIGQIGIARNDPDYFPLMVGNYILGQSPLASILFEEIRDKRGLSYHVGSGFAASQTPGPFMIVMQTRNERTNEAITATKETLQKFITDGPTREQLEQAKNGLIGRFPLSLDSNNNIATNLSAIGFYHLSLDYLDTYRTNIAAVTIDQIKAAFQRHVQTDKLSIITVGK
jgi:zinc protease